MVQGTLCFSQSCKMLRRLMYQLFPGTHSPTMSCLMRPRFPGTINMTVSETLKLLRTKEKSIGSLLTLALSLKRYREDSNVQLLRPSDAFYLPAVNSKARIKWGAVFIHETFEFFGAADDKLGLLEPFFLVTIADKSHVTTDHPQPLNLSRIKRTLGAGLQGLSYIGMIEPGYYNVIYDEFGKQRKNVVSWHGRFLVWDATEKQLAKNLESIKSRFTPIMSSRCP
jgi:hypothetical protein